MAQAADPAVRTASPVEVVPYGPTFVAEIRGIDFTRPVSDAVARTVHRALMEYKVLFFRDAEMTPAQHVAFGKQFGELTIHPFVPHLDEYPEALNWAIDLLS